MPGQNSMNQVQNTQFHSNMNQSSFQTNFIPQQNPNMNMNMNLGMGPNAFESQKQMNFMQTPPMNTNLIQPEMGFNQQSHQLSGQYFNNPSLMSNSPISNYPSGLGYPNSSSNISSQSTLMYNNQVMNSNNQGYQFHSHLSPQPLSHQQPHLMPHQSPQIVSQPMMQNHQYHQPPMNPTINSASISPSLPNQISTNTKQTTLNNFFSKPYGSQNNQSNIQSGNSSSFIGSGAMNNNNPSFLILQSICLYF